MSRDDHRPTILVVDDEDAILRLLAEALSRAGFEVLTAGSGVEAVAAYRSRDGIDLVLLDVRMPPPLDGPHTLRELRRLDPTVRAAFMSGSTGEYTDEDLCALGALRVFAKPFASLDELADALRELVPT
jgi:CheY-like chemotaxis protein